MPIYEYQCDACGHHFEVMRRMSDTSSPTCPECQATTVTKWVSAPAFQLKGTGWYATDFKDKKTPSETDDKDKKQDEKKTDAKPSATKEQSKPQKKTDDD